MVSLQIASLPDEIERLRLSAKLPGCSIAVVDETEVIWSAGFGLADLRERRAATPETVYHLFSGTKLLTAVAVLQLAERGFLDIENPVTAYLPEFEELSEVRIVDLLSHRSGLKDTLRGFMTFHFPPGPPPTTMEALARYRIAPSRPPGKRVEYRNVNYALLGEVVTRMSGSEYHDYLDANVLSPLDMRVGFDPLATTGALAATGYLGRWDPIRLVLRLVVPDVTKRLYRGRIGSQLELNKCVASSAIGGLVGNVLEFARFLQAQLSGGGGVLTPRSTDLMQTLVAPGQPGIESREGMGLGWKFGTAQNGEFLNHEGGGPGFTSELRLYPDAGIGIALAINAMRMPHTNRAAHRICEVVVSHRTRCD